MIACYYNLSLGTLRLQSFDFSLSRSYKVGKPFQGILRTLFVSQEDGVSDEVLDDTFNTSHSLDIGPPPKLG